MPGFGWAVDIFRNIYGYPIKYNHESVIGNEGALGFCDLAQLAAEIFDGISRVNK